MKAQQQLPLGPLHASCRGLGTNRGMRLGQLVPTAVVPAVITQHTCASKRSMGEHGPHDCVCCAQINTLALWNMGRMIEPQLGAGPFLTVYLGSGEEGLHRTGRCCGAPAFVLSEQAHVLHSTLEGLGCTHVCPAVLCCGWVCLLQPSPATFWVIICLQALQHQWVHPVSDCGQGNLGLHEDALNPEEPEPAWELHQ